MHKFLKIKNLFRNDKKQTKDVEELKQLQEILTGNDII